MDNLNDVKPVEAVKPAAVDIPLIPEMMGKPIEYKIPPLPKDKRPGGKDWRPPYFNALVEYYADPSEQRTLKDWCKDEGFEEMTIHQYKRNHPVELWTAVDNTRITFIPKMRREAFNAVFSNIKKSHLDRKLALQLTNDLIERTSITDKPLTPEEKRELAKEIIAKLGRKLDTGEGDKQP